MKKKLIFLLVQINIKKKRKHFNKKQIHIQTNIENCYHNVNSKKNQKIL